MVKKKATCLNCNKEFYYYTGMSNGKFCCIDCCKSYHRIVNYCITCEKKIITYPSLNQKFCSQKCYGESKKNKPTWNAGLKGVMPTPWNKGTKGVMKPNSGSFKKGRKVEYIESKCPICDKLFEHLPNKYRVCCSKRCQYELLRQVHWRGGVSFEPYGLEFNNKLKHKIRKRDNHTCQECGYTENELRYKLSVHHIDYNKRNNNPNNLISLCRNCHSQTNFKKQEWIDYYKEKVMA